MKEQAQEYRSVRILEAAAGDAPLLSEIVRQSFQDVARRFGLTPVTCPKHPSNCQPAWIEQALERGSRYFLLEADRVPSGCVAMEHPEPAICYLERLAVLPPYRGRGHGQALVAHVLREAAAMGAARVEIGIIAAHAELRRWYERRGFSEARHARFPHLPFEVLFMTAPTAHPAGTYAGQAGS